MGDLPLSGIRILEFGHTVMGPSCSMVLADLGADGAKLPGLPLDMDGRKTRVRQQPPRMGEHTRAVLAEAGYSRAQIEELIDQRVVIAPASTSINAVKEN